MYCPHCETEIKDGTEVCPACGRLLVVGTWMNKAFGAVPPHSGPPHAVGEGMDPTKRGGPGVLEKLVSRLHGEGFTGYLMYEVPGREPRYEGHIIFMDGLPVSAFIIGPPGEETFGNEALERMVEGSRREACELSHYELEEAKIRLIEDYFPEARLGEAAVRSRFKLEA